MSTTLVCPDCHSPDLEELERVIYTQPVEITRNENGSIDKHWPVAGEQTDGGDVVGVQCRACGWTYMSDNYVGALVPEDASN